MNDERKSLQFLYELFQELIDRKFIGESVVGVTEPIEKNGVWVSYFGEDMKLSILSPKNKKYRIYENEVDVTSIINHTNYLNKSHDWGAEEVIDFFQRLTIYKEIDKIIYEWEREEYHYGKKEDYDDLYDEELIDLMNDLEK